MTTAPSRAAVPSAMARSARLADLASTTRILQRGQAADTIATSDSHEHGLLERMKMHACLRGMRPRAGYRPVPEHGFALRRNGRGSTAHSAVPTFDRGS